jgi:hypothetical protein
MKHPIIPSLGLAVLAVVSLVAPAHATLVYDNLGNDPFFEALYENDSWGASKFTTDGYDYILNTVVLRMYRSGVSTAQLDIYSDVAGLPGASLGTLNSPGTIPLGTPDDLTFTASGIFLLANSSYWAVLRAPTGQLWWSYTEDPSGVGPGFSPMYTLSEDAGATWGEVVSFYPNQLQINADFAAIPEPASTLALGGLLASALGLRTRRRVAAA